MSKLIDYEIFGDDMQALEITLDQGETIRSEAGSMLYMQEGIEMETNMSGGLLGGLKRVVSGESLFLTSYTNRMESRHKVAFASPYPGKIIRLELSEIGGEYFCQRSSFLCSDSNVNIEITFTKKLGAGFFGGEGFILQKLTGSGEAFIHAGGTIIQKQLAQGEVLKVDTGCIVAFSSAVQYDIKYIGGVKNALFGGEGLFLATLQGPGDVYLQSLPFSRMADRIISASHGMSNRGESRGIAGIGGDMIGGIISGK